MEVKTISKRAQEFLAKPRHITTSNPKELEQKKWLWNFSLEKSMSRNLLSDKILTLFYFNISGSTLELLFLEAMSRMVLGRDLFFLQRLTFRELENFLRDENHLPVFDISRPIAPEISFNEVKNSLLVSIIKDEMRNVEAAGSEFKGWDELSFVEKNLLASGFMSSLNNLISAGKPLQLVLAEKDLITIAINDFPINVEVIEELARETFDQAHENSSLKVVAVQ
jgi:hypothetical protein